MSVEINDAEKNRGVEFTKEQGLNDMNEPIDSKFKAQQKSVFNANDVAMNITKKTNAKKQEGQEFKKKTQEKQETQINPNQDPMGENNIDFEQSPQGLKKKGLVGFLGDIAKGVFGSSKKQQDELRRLEVEVKALDKDSERLESLLNHTSLDSISAQFESSISMNDDEGESIDGHQSAAKENELIDESARNNMKKSDKLDRISQLRKKGVK